MSKNSDEALNQLMLHYNRGRQDMDTRRTRKNGWNDVWRAYMNKLPENWPYKSVVTDPRIRTTILEKTARLLNSKLRGRLVPREGGDAISARIQNALLDFQWDYANCGGSMVEKVAMADQICRVYGASFAFVYWDSNKNTNEIKVCDPRDLSFDGSATHIRDARWVQYREFTTIDVLEARGYDVKRLKKLIREGVSAEKQDVSYESIVKSTRGLDNRVGEMDDSKNPVLEVVTEWRYPDNTYSIFLPRLGEIIVDNEKSPYEHGKLPFAMLRYYPIGDDIYGESEVEPVMPIQRAINAVLCGFIDEMNISMNPPLKVSPSGVRLDTIVYGPGALWVMQNPNMVQEMEFSSKVIANFNATYPALVAAFNTAMGDQSLGVSNTVVGNFSQKTATEVRDMAAQQSSRDQYNQLYLSEFLKDVMLMWISNNKQYLFDDPAKQYHIVKIVGKDNIKALQQMGLGNEDIPDYAMREIADTLMTDPNVPDDQLRSLIEDVSVPEHAMVMNPDAMPEEYEVKKKLSVAENGEEADMYMTKDDFVGEYDYVPDVASMASGANANMKAAREMALQYTLNPQVLTMLQQQGESINIKDILVSALEDAGYRDAEGLFTEAQNGQPNTPGAGVPQPGAGIDPALGPSGMESVPSALPVEPSAGELPQAF